MKKLAILALSAAVLGLAAACGTTTNGATESPTPTNPAGSPTPTPSAYTATTVHDIQTGTETATQVEINDVVVTAVMPVKSGISFWVQDAGGGQFSGVLVYDLHAATPTDLAVGDVVTVQGTHDEFTGTGTTPWASAQTEIVPDVVTVTDHSTPTVDLLPDPSQLADGAGEPWEGCLVEIDMLHVASVGAGYGEYSVADSAGNYVRVDHSIVDTFEPRLLGEHIDSVVGVVEDSYDHYHVVPRDLNDVKGSATNAPVALSITDVQDKTSPNHPVQGQLVTLTDVLVSGTAPWTSTSGRTKTDFWVQTTSMAAANGGIFIDDGNYTAPGVTLGDTVTVTGKYVEMGSGGSGLGTNVGSAILLFPDHLVGTPSATGATVTPVSLSLATLKGSSAKDYDGVLVQLTDTFVTVSSMNPDAPADYGNYVVTDGTNTVRIDNLAYQTRNAVTLNGHLSLVRGAFHKVAGIWTIEPRSAADIASGN